MAKKTPQRPNNTPTAFDRLRAAGKTVGHQSFKSGKGALKALNSGRKATQGDESLNNLKKGAQGLREGNPVSAFRNTVGQPGRQKINDQAQQYANKRANNPYSIQNNRKGYGVGDALNKNLHSGDYTKGVKDFSNGHVFGAAYHGAKAQHRLGKGIKNDLKAAKRAHKKFKQDHPSQQQSTRQHPNLFNYMNNANGNDNPNSNGHGGMNPMSHNKNSMFDLDQKGDPRNLAWHYNPDKNARTRNLAWNHKPTESTDQDQLDNRPSTSLSHQLESPQEQRDEDAEERQKHRHPYKMPMKAGKSLGKTLGRSAKMMGNGAKKGAAGSKGLQKAKGAAKGATESAPIWLKILGAMLGINLLSRLALHTQMFLDNMFPFLNDLLPMLKGLANGAKDLFKGTFGLLGKGLHLVGKGIGMLGHGALNLGRGVVHAVMHPFSAIGSATSAVQGVVTGAAPLTGAELGKMAMVGAAVFGGYVANQDAFFTRTADDIGCAVQQMKGDAGNVSMSGTSGEWTKKGTKAYNIAKATYIAAKAQGCDDKHAAAVTGNAAHESGMFAMGLDVHQEGGGPGIGIFQFNDPPKDMSPSGQVKAIFANAPGRKNGWEKSSGDVSSLTNSFEEIFERGGIPDNGRRDALAEKAYSMFNGMGKEADSASDNAGSASGAAKGACGDAQQDADSGSIIPFAKRYLGLPYSEAVPERDEGAEDIGKGKPKSDCHKADCVSYVWGVYKHLGYKVTAQPWITTNMLKGDGNGTVQPISSSQARPGDCIVDHAHGAILLQPWHGKSTQIINEGGGKNEVNIASYEYSFYSVMSEPLHFGRPVKK